jgi:hypothetical protein
MKTPKNITEISNEILAEVEREEQVKLAEVTAIREATPRHVTEIGTLLHKVAEDLRATPRDVTYDDLRTYLENRQ